jgi:hypothetical protein
MANPMNLLPTILSIVKEMRQTYKNRQDHRVQLFYPLEILSCVHQSCGELEKAVEVLKEALDTTLPPPLSYIIGPEVQLRLAQLYTCLHNRRLAKKVHIYFVPFYLTMLTIIIYNHKI